MMTEFSFLGELLLVNLDQNVFKIPLFHIRYTIKPLTFLLTYRLRFTDIKIIIKLLHNVHFLILSLKQFTITNPY